MISIEQLNQAEQQIESLLTQNESNWKAIAKIARSGSAEGIIQTSRTQLIHRLGQYCS